MLKITRDITYWPCRPKAVYSCLPTPYWLTPCNRILLEKVTGLLLDKKFPAFYGNRRFITTVTSARHLSLSWATVQVRGLLFDCFATRYALRWGAVNTSANTQAGVPPFVDCPTAFSIYSQLPSILQAVSLSATCGRAMWQGHTYHGYSYCFQERYIGASDMPCPFTEITLRCT